jgi:hypothetical protein
LSIDPLQLLRRLEPPVRPHGAPAASGPGQPPIETRGFGELMSLVASGAIQSDRGVSIAPDANLADELSTEDEARLASAADVAEASGARRAVMLMDGRGLVMDIGARSITGEISAGQELVNLDAAVYVAGSEESAPALLPPPADGVRPPGVARHFEAVDAAAGAANTEPNSARRAG